MQQLQDTIINDWVGPLFLILVAALAIMFVVKKQWVSAISFAGIAVLVALFVFFGEDLFGDGGHLTGVGEGLSTQIGEGAN